MVDIRGQPPYILSAPPSLVAPKIFFIKMHHKSRSLDRLKMFCLPKPSDLATGLA